jgi:hypothetical protein
MNWIQCDGEIWDYEKVFYAVKLKDGTETWAWPNAGKLTDVSFSPTSSENIPIENVEAYCAADDEYFDMMENR